MSKKKYYVVWQGTETGVYDSWTECQLRIKGIKNAQYKSFESKEEAERAYASSPFAYLNKQNQNSNANLSKKSPSNELPTAVEWESIAVDAACSGNPGPMEYRGVYLRDKREIFHYGPVQGTNNIGEFLAIVHGLALLKQKNLNMPIYSDSQTAIGWVKKKKCKTLLVRNEKTEALFLLIERAEKWLKENTYTTRIIKWETKLWGEVPADFGRK